MGKCFYKIFYLLFLTALYSCGRLSADDSQPLIPIDFSVRDYTAEVKGISLTTDNISSFGVFAALEENSQAGFSDVDASELQPFMDNVPVTKDASGRWTANPPYYWPILNDKSLSFFAYAPHSYAADMEVVAGWGEESQVKDRKSVEIRYTLNSNPAKHVDLSVAAAILDRVRDTDGDGNIDPVVFGFRHTLAAVSFAANYIGNLPEGCYLRIDELTIGQLVNSNTLIYDSSQSDFFEWNTITPQTPRTGSYVLNVGSLTIAASHRINQKSTDLQVEDIYTDFVTVDGVLYALPQEVNPAGLQNKAKMDITFSYVKNDSHAVVAQFYTSVDLPNSMLEVSRKYKYQFTLDVTTASLINISCVDKGAWIIDWNDSKNNHSDTIIK